MPISQLRFGIPSLDAILVGKNEREVVTPISQDWGGIELSRKSEGTSVCLIGPDGTGKSVFSMHLASQYLWDIRNLGSEEEKKAAKVIYVSTDLRYEMAERMFDNFELSRSVGDRKPGALGDEIIQLTQLATGDASSLTDFLLGTGSQSHIGFVDLASDSAGDDWGLVTRIVSLLDEQSGNNTIRHLLVVDAVEGLETLAGETDAYGQKVSRRARIALLMRLAAHKCHIMLVVEESKEGIRLPEEFVADIVIRLRSTLVNGYTRRTLELEKARGQAHHARGQHPFQIRSSEELEEKPAHITIYPSLHYQGNAVRERTKKQPAPRPSSPTALGPDVLSFGIRHLDSMLKRGRDGFGLHAGMPFAILGDKGTFKSRLADAYVACSLADVCQNFSHPDSHKWRESWNHLAQSAGVAVLCTSKPRSELNRSLVRQLLKANPRAAELLRANRALKDRFEQHVAESLETRIIPDQLVIQDQPGPRLFHRVQSLIYKAKEVLKNIPNAAGQFQRVRLVIDDLSSFRDAYPELREDPLLLPLIIQFTRLEQISTLLVATQPVEAPHTELDRFDAAVRAQVEGYLLTWRVSFFGEARAALRFVAGAEADCQPTIRHVFQKGVGGDEASATDVDPEFELYDGLEAGRPVPVPLEIRLYVETPAFQEYVDNENQILGELFQRPDPVDGKRSVIAGVNAADYDVLRDYCYLNASGKLLKTLILQIDEFWRPAKKLGMLASLDEYASTIVDGDVGADPYEDQYGLFKLANADAAGKPRVDRAEDLPVGKYPETRKRRDFFPEYRRPGPDQELIDRIPFMWDFGFLLLAHNDWYSAVHARLPFFSRTLWKRCSNPSKWQNEKWPDPAHPIDNEFWRDMNEANGKLFYTGITVGTVLDALRKPERHLEARAAELADHDRRMLKELAAERALFRGPSSWRVVLEAATEVKRRRTARDSTVVRSFDLARPSAESFSSLILEIWFSEIVERYSWKIRQGGPDSAEARKDGDLFVERLSSFEAEKQFDLKELVEKYFVELYAAWMLLVESIDMESLVDRDHRFELRSKADSSPAMAARHWYKTAAQADSARYSERPALPVRLPGYFSTRGDWYLAMAAGSRSYRLGTRALDLLNSRRANIARLQYGLGLPVRDIVDPQIFSKFRTRLSYVNYGGRRATVDYSSLIGLGGQETRSYLCPDDASKSPDAAIDIARVPFRASHHNITSASDSFFWIWRSRIRDYDRHSRIWAKWLIRIALLMQGIKNDESASWLNGFDVYDRIALADTDTPPAELNDLRSWNRFKGMVDFLMDELQWAAASAQEASFPGHDGAN